MNRKEKISILKTIQAGGPIKIVLQDHITLFNILNNESVCFDIDGNPADPEYYKKYCKSLSFITCLDRDQMHEIMKISKKIKETD